MIEPELDLKFPLGKIDFDDKGFMQRTDRERWEKQVKRIKKSIKQEGQRDPVSLGKLKGQDTWIRLAGFTRTEALKRLGKEHVKAYLYDQITKKQAGEINVTDNTMRYDLDPIDKAEAMLELKDKGVPVESEEDDRCLTFEFDMGKAEIYRWLKVAREGNQQIKDAVRNGLPLTHAITMINNREKVDNDLIEQDLEKNWTAKDLELEMDLGGKPKEIENERIEYDDKHNQKQQFISLLAQLDFDEMEDSDFNQLHGLLKESVQIMRKY